MTEKIVILTPTSPEPIARALRDAGGFEPFVAEDAQSALQNLEGAVGLVVGGFFYRDLFPEFRRCGSSLKWLQSVGSGYDVFGQLGIPPGAVLMRAVGVWGHSVAGHAVALTLALMRNLPDLLTAQQKSHWSRDTAINGIRSAAGQRILVLGYGDVGQTIAAAFKALDADVQVVASRARTEANGDQVAAIDDLDTLLPQADAVVMSIPATPQTHHLIDAGRMARMRTGAILVNVGRGETVDEAALVQALRSGQLGGAGLDVFSHEPLPEDSPLWRCPSLIITPHVANFGDKRSVEKLATLTVANAQKIARREQPEGLVSVPEFFQF